LRVRVDACLHWHEERRCRPIHERVGLSLDVYFNKSARRVGRDARNPYLWCGPSGSPGLIARMLQML
jgi:hypothetical protein